MYENSVDYVSCMLHMDTSSWISKVLFTKVQEKEGTIPETQRMPKIHSSFGQRLWEKN